MRVSVKKLLKKYGYPPDMQILATKNILEQAELMCSDIVATA
jgi:type I restriction enzyme R subunit